MIRRWNSYIKKLLLYLLILSGLTASLYSQDKHISGIINVYKRVVAIGPGFDNVTLSNVDSISPGDTVLLIQMKGVRIVTAQDGYGQGVQDTIGKPGGYEFLLVQSVNGVTNKIVFRNNILSAFDIKGSVQLIRVPYYNSATVTGTLIAKSWDSVEKTGGVVSMILGRKLNLNAGIDVSGKGFLGGKDTIGIGECVLPDLTLNNHDSYPRSWLNAGYKGEGIASHDEFGNSLEPLHMKGRGINFTGGGGGNGKYSGGGGGGNRGIGSDGSSEKNLGVGKCPDPQPGAYGATSVNVPIITDGIFFGGGGGTSTHASGSTGSSGGNGGGIVIIIADTLSGRNKTINADGKTAGNAFLDGGAGGGGAGGSVILSLQSFSDVPTDSLKISVKGGNGGTNQDGFGNGGGGGGGFVWVSTPTIPSKVQVEMNFGIPGPLNPSGGMGETRFSFIPKLNGFLFNSIRSAVTGDQVDSICSNVPFGMISGTSPVGGKPGYTYMWESSTISESAGYVPATGINNLQNYSPGLLTQTSWFHRVVTDNSSPVITDISKPVKIIVQQAITGNLVGKDTTICYNQNPLALLPLNTGPANGNGIYAYKWIQNLTNTNWNTSPDAAGTIINPGYDPPALTGTTYYKRIVISGSCIDFSPAVTITVLPLITGNITSRPDSVICEGSLFNSLGASAAGGGDITYKYQWQDSIISSVWKPAIGTNTDLSYSPDTSTFSAVEGRFFRRVVFSGPDSVCTSKSLPILLTRYHKIKNNLIAADQTICSGSRPQPLSGSTPTQGSGLYTYIWQDSSKLNTWTARGTVGSGFSPQALTDTTWYVRIVNSSKCTNTSLSVRVNVHKPIINNKISLLGGGLTDTTICNGQVPNLLKGTIAAGGSAIPGDYAYLWFSSTDNNIFNPVASSGTGVNYQPPALTTTNYYKRQVMSGACTVMSSDIAPIKVTVLPLISNNIISVNQTVCYNTTPSVLTGATLAGGTGTYKYFWEESADGGTDWTAATGSDNSSGSYQPPRLTIPMEYRRTVKSGLSDCCTSVSNPTNIGINPLPVSKINAGPDVLNYYSIEKIFHMAADPPLPGESGFWTLGSNGSGIIEDISNNLTEIRNLSPGKNTYLWTITNGPCKIEDSVNIYLSDDFVPSGFSPNNDSWNNAFIVPGLNLPDQIAELKVVNGAGTEVFTTSNKNGRAWSDWDGKNSKGIDLPEGTYYYILKITSKENGQVFRKSGFIVLKRY